MSASPDRTKLIARVTTMVGHPGDVDHPTDCAVEQGGSEHDPQTDQQTQPQRLSVHETAAVLLASSIIAPTDRSIPPVMTITACPIAR